MQKPEFTHIAKLYGCRCYFNDETMEVKGTNWFNDSLISLFLLIEKNLPINEGFLIEIIDEIKTDNP